MADPGTSAGPGTSARAPWILGLGVPAAFVAAVFLSGPLYQLVLSTRLTPPFSKVFRYLLLVLLATVICWALRPWRDVPRDLWGLRGPRSKPWLALVGAVTALTLLATVALLDAAAGHLVWDGARGAKKFAVRWPAALGRLVVLGLLEEMVFRGWLFEKLRRSFSDPRAAFRAALVVAAVYAGLHAFRESDAPRRLVAGPEGALEILEAWAGNFVDVVGFGSSFLGLFLLSMALSGGYLRFRTLWFGVGLHGAAIAYLPLHSALTKRTIQRDWFGTKWLYDGVPGWILLAVLAFCLWPRHEPHPMPTLEDGA